MFGRFLLVFCAALLGACVLAAQVPVRDMIIDTDMGLDDVRALFAILADTNSTVLGIVTVEGSASLGKGTDNLIGLLESLGLEDLPVYRGMRRAGAESPPWRSTADGLAGNPFPPPRHIAALDLRDGYRDLCTGAGEKPRYLALGPLGNLAALQGKMLGEMESIWLPAVVAEGRLRGWNLAFDPESALDILSRAKDIVIVDVGPANGMDARSILESVEGTSAAARYATPCRRIAPRRDR